MEENMNDARRIRIVFGRDGFQMELVEERQDDNVGTRLTFGQKVIWFLTFFVTGGAIVNAIYVFGLR